MLRPQDVLVVLELALQQDARPTYQELSKRLEMSTSEVHGAVRRATAAGLLGPDRTPKRTALVEFLVHGVKYAFSPRRGQMTRGMPTAHGAPPLDKIVTPTSEPVPVWPDPDGDVRGESFEPLYRSVTKAARKDAKLYEALCLVDAIRGGRARERALAEKLLEKMLRA